MAVAKEGEVIYISIHVPRKRDDLVESAYALRDTFISIHVPRKRDDPEALLPFPVFPNFNPRPPQEGRQVRRRRKDEKRWIAIHVPRKRDDDVSSISTLRVSGISIHVPRKRDDY